MANVDTVQEIYAAFGRGDVPAILERLAEDVRWEDWAPTSRIGEVVPYLATRVGRDAVAAFFGEIAGALEFERFEPSAFLASDDQVAAVINVVLTVKSTGTRLEDTEIHLWTFGPDGEIIALRHFVDTLQHAEAQSGLIARP